MTTMPRITRMTRTERRKREEAEKTLEKLKWVCAYLTLFIFWFVVGLLWVKGVIG